MGVHEQCIITGDVLPELTGNINVNLKASGALDTVLPTKYYFREVNHNTHQDGYDVGGMNVSSSVNNTQFYLQYNANLTLSSDISRLNHAPHTYNECITSSQINFKKNQATYAEGTTSDVIRDNFNQNAGSVNRVDLTSSLIKRNDSNQHINKENGFYKERYGFSRLFLHLQENFSPYSSSFLNNVIYSASNEPNQNLSSNWLIITSSIGAVKTMFLQGDSLFRASLSKDSKTGNNYLSIRTNDVSGGPSDFGKPVSGSFSYITDATVYNGRTTLIGYDGPTVSISSSFYLQPSWDLIEILDGGAYEEINIRNSLIYLHTSLSQSIPIKDVYIPDGFTVSIIATGFEGIFSIPVPLFKMSNTGYIMIPKLVVSVDTKYLKTGKVYYEEILDINNNRIEFYNSSYNDFDVVVDVVENKYNLSMNNVFLGRFDLAWDKTINLLDTGGTTVYTLGDIIAVRGYIISSDPFIPCVTSGSYMVRSIKYVTAKRPMGFYLDTNNYIIQRKSEQNTYNKLSFINSFKSLSYGYDISLTQSNGDKYYIKQDSYNPNPAVEFIYNVQTDVKDFETEMFITKMKNTGNIWDYRIFPYYRNYPTY